MSNAGLVGLLVGPVGGIVGLIPGSLLRAVATVPVVSGAAMAAQAILRLAGSAPGLASAGPPGRGG